MTSLIGAECNLWLLVTLLVLSLGLGGALLAVVRRGLPGGTRRTR